MLWSLIQTFLDLLCVVIFEMMIFYVITLQALLLEGSIFLLSLRVFFHVTLSFHMTKLHWNDSVRWNDTLCDRRKIDPDLIIDQKLWYPLHFSHLESLSKKGFRFFWVFENILVFSRNIYFTPNGNKIFQKKEKFTSGDTKWSRIHSVMTRNQERHQEKLNGISVSDSKTAKRNVQSLKKKPSSTLTHRWEKNFKHLCFPLVVVFWQDTLLWLAWIF